MILKNYNFEKVEYKKGKMELKVLGIKKWFFEICDFIVSYVKELFEE